MRRACTDKDAETHGLSFELLAYDRRGDALWYSDQSGHAVRRSAFEAVGSGGSIALGVLDASPAARTLDGAERLVRKALAAACRRNAACGGRMRVLVAPRRGTVTLR